MPWSGGSGIVQTVEGRQEQGPQRRVKPAAAVGLPAGLYLDRKMDEGPRWARVDTLQQDALFDVVAVLRRDVFDGGAGVTSEAETDTVEAVVAAESISCV